MLLGVFYTNIYFLYFQGSKSTKGKLMPWQRAISLAILPAGQKS